MDLKQIEYFVRVAELGSFTHASVALDIAQPALSRQIRRLEIELRQPLLLRNGRGVTMTEAGKIMLEHGRGVLHQVERIREELSRARGGYVGRVAVGLPPSLARVLTVPLTRAFQTAMPDAILTISEGLSVTMQESIAQGRLDVALIYDSRPSPEIEIHPLTNQALHLLQSSRHASDTGPIDLEAVAKLPLIMPSRPNAIRMLVEHELATRGRRPRIAIEADAIPAILDLVADGLGAAILPASALHAFGRDTDFHLRPIQNPALVARLAWAVSARRPMTQVQRNLVELIETQVRTLLPGT
ncbi:LysR substrate-binding domain-containing protein [Denitromonas iodatirespirans]|uniref:LysR family transcriptional regulator n=1 Tax=Denitromonas iodatirespirans TaxID=2795389 RepID=A0A944DHG9_DENI1|nr:LysR substrate-binding domain-containing protein [Denitromonas iodatirespirans]MBT0962958.1 LysR family transcriptional regulator [Denitromonas iodatirespirans]